MSDLFASQDSIDAARLRLYAAGWLPMDYFGQELWRATDGSLKSLSEAIKQLDREQQSREQQEQ